MRVPLLFAGAVVALSGCAGRAPEVAVAPPVVVPAAPTPMPRPPANAAASVVLPARLADGSFDTPNRAPSKAAAIWHLRAALNVAALRCNDEALLGHYNGFIGTQRAALAAAHKALGVEHGGQTAFDAAMTRLYNYFALPPVQPGFCVAAATVAAEVAALPAGGIVGYAPLGLPLLDAPFQNFFRDYGAYRVALAGWQAGRAAPRLAYDASVTLAEFGPRRAAGVAMAAR